MYFLTEYGHLANTVIYAGAAPGAHIPYLSFLFPKHKFILVDPNEFNFNQNSFSEDELKERIEVH